MTKNLYCDTETWFTIDLKRFHHKNNLRKKRKLNFFKMKENLQFHSTLINFSLCTFIWWKVSRERFGGDVEKSKKLKSLWEIIDFNLSWGIKKSGRESKLNINTVTSCSIWNFFSMMLRVSEGMLRVSRGWKVGIFWEKFLRGGSYRKFPYDLNKVLN